MPLLLFLLIGCANNQYRELSSRNNDPFYQEEKDKGYSGEKRLLDRIYQLDPGQRFFRSSPSFLQNPPKKLALLPFENLQGGDFMLNGGPFPERTVEEKKDWSWTYANRVRRFFFAHLSLREFELLGLLETDAILKELGITSPEKLYKCDPKELGKALGVDAVIYGKVTHYGAHYYLLFTQVVVGLYVRCVSTNDGSTLFEVGEVRRDNNIRIATNPIDFAAGSIQNVIVLRDLYVAKAADEVSREVVARIPMVKSLQEERIHRWKSLAASSQKIQGVKARLGTTDNDGSLKIHKVKKGDTLYRLARQYYNDSSRWRTIFEANRENLTDKDRLVPGQTLVIP
ncbi:MAG: GNA1162 family protein [Candidatus Brocadiales bacterium]